MQFEKHTHQYWMNEVIGIARTVKDEVPICALVVKDNELISCAVNKIETLIDSTAHAEIIAIREASKLLGDWRLNNCVLYSTLEPCAMCAGAIVNARISKVVFGAYDYNAGACGSMVNVFKDLNKSDQVEIIGGVLEIEASDLLKSFFVSKR